MAGTPPRRLMTEYRELLLNPADGILAGPTNEDNLFEWEAVIAGPDDTCFEGGEFPAKITLPSDYPHSPPEVRFLCDMFHPNIYPDGRVCLSILYAHRWSPALTIEKVLLSVMSMLAAPDVERSTNLDAAKMWLEDRDQYNRRVQAAVRMSLGLPPVPALTSVAP